MINICNPGDIFVDPDYLDIHFRRTNFRRICTRSSYIKSRHFWTEKQTAHLFHGHLLLQSSQPPVLLIGRNSPTFLIVSPLPPPHSSRWIIKEVVGNEKIPSFIWSSFIFRWIGTHLYRFIRSVINGLMEILIVAWDGFTYKCRSIDFVGSETWCWFRQLYLFYKWLKAVDELAILFYQEIWMT